MTCRTRSSSSYDPVIWFMLKSSTRTVTFFNSSQLKLNQIKTTMTTEPDSSNALFQIVRSPRQLHCRLHYDTIINWCYQHDGTIMVGLYRETNKLQRSNCWNLKVTMMRCSFGLRQSSSWFRTMKRNDEPELCKSISCPKAKAAAVLQRGANCASRVRTVASQLEHAHQRFSTFKNWLPSESSLGEKGHQDIHIWVFGDIIKQLEARPWSRKTRREEGHGQDMKFGTSRTQEQNAEPF